MTNIISRQNDGAWWSTYDDGIMVWASGDTVAESDALLIELVPQPYEGGDPTEAHQVIEGGGGTGYSAWDSDQRVVVTGQDADTAEAVLMTHVPVPQPTEQTGDERPPKLEKKPLPPV